MMSNYTKLIWTLLVVAACVLPVLTQDGLGADPAAGAAGSAVEGASDNADQGTDNGSLEIYGPQEGVPSGVDSATNIGGTDSNHAENQAASLEAESSSGGEGNHDASPEGSNPGDEGSHEFSGPDSAGANPEGGPGAHVEGGPGAHVEGGPGAHVEGGGASDLEDVETVVGYGPNFDGEGHYNDTTNFVVGVNSWNFHGWWAKFNISEKNVMDIPMNEESKNHMAFICKVKEYESFLEKNFPALADARIMISYYLSSAVEDLVMTLTMEQPGRPPLTIFTYTFPDDLKEHHELWVSQDVQIPSVSRIQPFKIKLSLSSENSSVWATDELQVLGSAPMSQPMMNYTYPPLTTEPEVNATSPPEMTNHTLPAVNVTSPPASNASLSSNMTGEGTNQTSASPSEGGKTEDSNATGYVTPAPSSSNSELSDHKPRPTDTPRNDTITEVAVKPTSKPVQANASSVVPPKASTVVPPARSNASSVAPPIHSNASSVAPPFNSNASSVAPPIESNASSVDPEEQPIASTLVPNQPPPDGKIPQGNFTGIASFLNDLGRLESVAQAIWDAFYVFLALFCACLVALVALIVRGRCREDDPPPAVATYNPRTASYRLDKVYDNPSYDNNAV